MIASRLSTVRHAFGMFPKPGVAGSIPAGGTTKALFRAMFWMVVTEASDEASWRIGDSCSAAFEYPPSLDDFFERWLHALSPAERASLALYLGRLDGRPWPALCLSPVPG